MVFNRNSAVITKLFEKRVDISVYDIRSGSCVTSKMMFSALVK